MAATKPHKIKTQPVKASQKQTAPVAESCATGTCGCSTGGTCEGCDGRCACKTLFGCHFLGVLKQKRAIAGFAAMFVLMWVVQMVIHGNLLMDDYQASAALWLPEEAMRLSWFLYANAAIALAFTIVFNLAQKFKTYWEGVRLGLFLIMPSIAGVAYFANTMPIPSTILWGWALEGVAIGVFGGLLLTAISRSSCCAGKWFGGCGKNR